jgi:hypothetical protein
MDDGWSRKRSSGKEDKVDSVMWDYLDATIWGLVLSGGS